jgi:hypothetical protein
VHRLEDVDVVGYRAVELLRQKTESGFHSDGAA